MAGLRYWLRRLFGAGCGGFVVLVAEAMWGWLRMRRLCLGLSENKADSAFKPALANAGAELGNKRHGHWVHCWRIVDLTPNREILVSLHKEAFQIMWYLLGNESKIRVISY